MVADGLGEVALLRLINNQNNIEKSRPVPPCNITRSWSVGVKRVRCGGLLGRLRCARYLFLNRGTIVQQMIRIPIRTATAAPATRDMTAKDYYLYNLERDVFEHDRAERHFYRKAGISGGR